MPVGNPLGLFVNFISIGQTFCPPDPRITVFPRMLGASIRYLEPVKEVLGVEQIAVVADCTGNQFRSVSRLENEAVLDRMQARIAQRPDILDQHRETIEHPFGTIKQWMNQGAFLMRGLEKGSRRVQPDRARL